MSDCDLMLNENFKLIVTIVKKGAASRIVAASKKAGAEGGTILFGRGTAKKSVYLDLLGINYDPEKEIIFTFVKDTKADTVLQVILDEAKLNQPGNGIGFVIDIKNIAGILHLLKADRPE